jgi:hypothetical protein
MKTHFVLINSFIIFFIINTFTAQAQSSPQQMYYQKLKTDLLSRDYQPVAEVNTTLTNGQLYSIPLDFAPGVTYKFFLIAPQSISASGIELQDAYHFRVDNNLLVQSGNTFLNEFTYYAMHSGRMYGVFSCVNPTQSTSSVNILIYKKNGDYSDDNLLPH